MTLRLQGARVLVTRPTEQSGNLCRLIEQAGGVAVRFPVIEIVPIEMPAAPVNPVEEYRWIVFVSANAVRFALSDKNGFAAGKNARIAAVGQATAAALRAAGLTVDLVPAAGFDSEALLAAPEMRRVDGLSVLIVRGEGGRELLADELRARGAKVDYLEVYRRTKPQIDRQTLAGLKTGDKPDVITANSGESLKNLMELAGEETGKILKSIPLAVVSERIKKTALEMGFARVAVSKSPSDAAVAAAVGALLDEVNRE
ncbi:MAG: uroporphyrinogen-III synthase [Gammaproteobacteria bacterium]